MAARLKGVELLGEANRRIDLQKLRRSVEGGSGGNGRRNGKISVQAAIHIVEKVT
jgi:hypothetical protein